MYAEYHCRVTNSGHECRSMHEYLNTEDFSPFAELKRLILDYSFNYGLGYSSLLDYEGGDAPWHFYRVNCINDLWDILSAYHTAEYSDQVGLSQEHNQILRILLQKIGITYNLEFHNLLLEECDGGGEFWCGNELNPEEAQWLRLAFRDRMEPCSAAGRIYVRNNVGGESVYFVTLNPLPVLINA